MGQCHLSEVNQDFHYKYNRSHWHCCHCLPRLFDDHLPLRLFFQKVIFKRRTIFFDYLQGLPVAADTTSKTLPWLGLFLILANNDWRSFLRRSIMVSSSSISSMSISSVSLPSIISTSLSSSELFRR